MSRVGMKKCISPVETRIVVIVSCWQDGLAVCFIGGCVRSCEQAGQAVSVGVGLRSSPGH